MRLRVRSIEKVALVVAIVASVLATVVVYAGLHIAAVIPIGVLVYISTWWLARRFVAYRIKPIYQMLHSRNISTSEIDKQHIDMVGEIESDIKSWADRNSREIARLKENEKYRKDFVGNVSHELKTPIFSIQGYILTLLDGGLEDERINRKYLEKAEANIDRLINIVNDLEQISKLEATNLLLNIKRFDVAELVRESVESLEVLARERNITIKVLFPEDSSKYVNADRKLISQVIINLLTNSIKYGRSGGTTKIHLIDAYDKLIIEVEDNGAGIEQSDLPRIFERFYRVDKGRSRSQGGTGLGLAIVKHIIEAHHQKITVRSTIDVGTTFSFTLDK